MCAHVYVHRDHKGIKVERCFMRLLVAGSKCLFICAELQSPRVAGERFAVGQAL